MHALQVPDNMTPMGSQEDVSHLLPPQPQLPSWPSSSLYWHLLAPSLSEIEAEELILALYNSWWEDWTPKALEKNLSSPHLTLVAGLGPPCPPTTFLLLQPLLSPSPGERQPSLH